METRTEYRITGRFRKYDKRHVVDWNRKWTLLDAERRLEELKKQAEWESDNKKRKAIECGLVGISTEYYSEYDLLDLKIEFREVSAWYPVFRE